MDETQTHYLKAMTALHEAGDLLDSFRGGTGHALALNVRGVLTTTAEMVRGELGEDIDEELEEAIARFLHEDVDDV